MDKQKPTINIPRPALGKGLASLLPVVGQQAVTQLTARSTSTASNEIESNKDRHPGISMCLIEDISPNEFQPRKSFDDETLLELAQSIQSNGLIQPLIVRKALQGKGYQLIAGERRLRAAKLAGLKQVPIVIRRTTDKEALELALIENIQREDLNCIDTALAYYQLIHDFDLKQEAMSERVGKDRTSIANHLRLLKLPQSTQVSLKDDLLTFGHGKALAGLEDSSLIEKLAQEVIEKKWSVRELEGQIQRLKALQGAREAKDENKASAIDPLQLRLRNLSKELSQKFSTKIHLRGNDKKGKISIEYFSAEDLDRVLQILLR